MNATRHPRERIANRRYELLAVWGTICLLYPAVWDGLLGQPGEWFYIYSWVAATALFFIVGAAVYAHDEYLGKPDAVSPRE